MGEWMKQQMKASQFTYDKLCATSGLARGSLIRWANGDRVPKLSTFLILCEVFAKSQNKGFTEMIVSGLKQMPEYQFAMRRGHK